jgi:hypothetical protein
MKSKTIIVLGDNSAYLPGVKAAVSIAKSSRNFMADPETLPQPVNIKNKPYLGIVPWGENNTLPSDTIAKIYANPVVSSGIEFNIRAVYGAGIAYGNKEIVNGKETFTPRNDVPEINAFLEENDINGYLLEQATDICCFYNVFPEIIFNRETPRKIVGLSSKEATFSRWEVMDPATAVIAHHFYSAKWGGQVDLEKDIDISVVLDNRWPLRDLRIRIGLLPNDKGEKKDLQEYRFIIPLGFPTPGRSYYQKPYWFSIFESGWYDYSCKIPEFKNALMDNQMVIKYHVELSEDYFPRIFAEEGITADADKKTRIKKEYTDLNRFLGNQKNSGKSVISFVRYSPEGKELRRMKINVLENNFKGGEYLDDSEEASNIMSYALGVHPSLIGSSPGKAKTINGTEARELWIIKQALMKPIRDRLLYPLYLIKAINGWPEEIHFAIPNIMLTTLDEGTGSKKVTS